MKRRSRGREVALQLLFQHDQNKTKISRKAIERFATDRLPQDADVVPWCLSLFDGVLAQRDAIDAILTQIAANWRLTRMQPVDRNVLRLGAYELLYDPTNTATAIVIDEMVELARRFGSAGSPAFVNGILDQVAKGRSMKAETAPSNPQPSPNQSS